MAAQTVRFESERRAYDGPTIDESLRKTALRMAFSLLRRWQCQMPMQEVESITDLAICEAAKRFDPDRGSSFSTFVYYYIKAELVKAVRHAVSAKKAVHALTKSAHLAGNTSLPLQEDLDASEGNADPDLYVGRQPESPESTMLEAERKEIVRAALGNLGSRHQRVLNLIYFQQAHPQTAARELGLTKRALRFELQRAKNALYKELESSGQLKTVSL